MEKLTNKEEQIMQVIWRLEKAFVKEIMAELTDEELHYNTLSTIVRNLEEKKYVGYRAFGKTHQYFPLVKLTDYRSKFMTKAVDSFFEGSYLDVVSFFAQEEKISAKELEEILRMIEKK
ncbi:BlaI/MecI/CopY family transcriptional regulator [Flavobacterium sp. JP2137]|uniref:BlaI/MecI/CopY family transcriptional regulator n=1 Tax=Flavobacterium sp. JP2137 TaxID=3414510 RepID=UPI003D2FD1B3